MLRVVNFLKFLSIALFLGILLLVYAYLPVMVKLSLEEQSLQLHKEHFFYYAIGVFVVINIFLLFIQQKTEPLIPTLYAQAWARAAAFVINIYVTLLIGFIGVINNTNHLDPSSFSYLNYMGPIIIFSWLVGLIYLLMKRS